MKLHHVCLFFWATVASLVVTTTSSGSPVVIGPGPRPLIYEVANVDYHILDGTQIISPSRQGPPETFVVVTDAIEFRGGGHIRIDGGYFRGGNATYTGPNGSLASVVAGEALHLRQSSGEVHGGIFIGGNANSTTWLGPTVGGVGLVLVESSLTIYGGYFEGGTSTRPQPAAGVRTTKEPGIVVLPGSLLVMHGGMVAGDISVYNSAVLSVFGMDLAYEGATLSGKYADGTPFSHSVPRSGGRILFNEIIPEPTSAVLLLVGGSFSFLLTSRRSSGQH